MKIFDRSREAIQTIREDELKMDRLKKIRVGSGIGWYGVMAAAWIQKIPNVPQIPLEPRSPEAIAFGIGTFACLGVHYATGKIIGKTWAEEPEKVRVAQEPDPVYAHVRTFDGHGGLVEDVSLTEAIGRFNTGEVPAPRVVHHPSSI